MNNAVKTFCQYFLFWMLSIFYHIAGVQLVLTVIPKVICIVNYMLVLFLHCALINGACCCRLCCHYVMCCSHFSLRPAEPLNLFGEFPFDGLTFQGEPLQLRQSASYPQ